MTEYSDDRLEQFSHFIEANLELDTFSGDPEFVPMGSMFRSESFHPPATYGELRHDIQAHFHFVHSEPPGHDSWLERLTPIEAQMRALVRELVLVNVQHRFEPALPEPVLRKLLTYAMTTSWFVFTGLLDQYTYDDDAGSKDIGDIPF